MQADEYDAAALVAVSPVQLDELQKRLQALVERSRTSAPVRALLERAVDDQPRARGRRSPSRRRR